MKSNTQFARKCISNLPRFEHREFNIVFTIDRTVKVLTVRPYSKEKLTKLFENMQQFFIDHDLLVTTVMGTSDDLFVDFSRFQFNLGIYRGTGHRDFLESVYGQFYQYTPDQDSINRNLLRQSGKDDDETIARKLHLAARGLWSSEGQGFLVRRYIPGPVGYNNLGQYHTTPWSMGLNADNTTTLEALADQDLVIIRNTSEVANIGERDLVFAIPVQDFIDFTKRRGYRYDEVSYSGTFSIHPK